MNNLTLILICLILSYVYGSFVEYFAHRFLMHHRIKGLEEIYTDHKIHHSIYRRGVFCTSSFNQRKFFNLIICLEHTLTFSIPIVFILLFINPLFAFILLGFSIFHYFLYNQLHSGMHLNHKLLLPDWYRKLTLFNHFMHHQHPNKFFCVALPGADYLLGSVCSMDKTDKESWNKLLKKEFSDSKNEDKKEIFNVNFCIIPKIIKNLKLNDGELPPRPTLKNRKIGRLICKIVTFIQLGKISIKGQIPDYPCIIASNHSSWLDVFIFPLLSNFPFRVMAAESVLKFNLLIGWFLTKYLGCYPAATRKAIDSSIELLKNGQSIFICPEGWSHFDGEIRKFKTGIIRIATKLNIPVIPINIKYSKLPPKWLMRLNFPLQCFLSGLFLMFKGDVSVIIGKPVNLHSGKDIKTQAEWLRTLIKNLK